MIKINYWICGFTLLIVPFLASGQKNMDSLNQVLKIKPGNLIVMNDLAEALTDSSPNEADSLASLALQMAQAENNTHEQSRALANLINAAWEMSDFHKALSYAGIAADLHLSTGNKMEAARAFNDAALAAYEIDLYDLARDNYQKALRNLLETEDSENIPSVLINLGQVYEKIGHADSAIYYYRQAIGLCQTPGMEPELSAAYGNLGIVYKNMGNFEAALENYTKARDISIATGDSASLATDLNNIASLYFYWENYNMARVYYQQALEIYQKEKALDKVEVTMSNLALLYQKEGKYDSALSLFDKSLAIARELGRTGSMAVKLSNMGVIYYTLKSYDTALAYQTQALEMSRDLGKVFSVCSALQNLGMIYLAKNNFTTAQKYFEEAAGCAEEIKSNIILEKVYKSQSELFEKMALPQQALEVHRKYMAVRDSIFTQQSHDKLAELEAVYQNEKKQQQIKLLLKDQELKDISLRKNTIILYYMGGGLLILLVSSTVIFMLFVQKARTNKILVEKNLKLMKQEECNEMTVDMKSTSGISDLEKARLMSDLSRLIKQEKIFTHKLLTLTELAEKLNTNTAYLSRIINEDYHDNFPNFINQLRVMEVQKMFAASRHKTMTIEGIADSVGFHSRSAFNVSFKKFTGVTPSSFIKNL